jgi:hypothetical protein
MDGFNALLGSLSQFAPVLNAGTGLAGLINQFSLASKEKSIMDESIYYSKNPQAISAIAAKLQQPLSSGLTSGVGNVVNASLAEQGLSQAPGIQSQVMSQALAPYQMQEQQMALEAALQAIGLPAQALAAIRGSMNPMQLASMLKGILPGQPPNPNLFGTWNGGSVGGVSDPALAMPQYMPTNIGPPLNPDDPSAPSLTVGGGS